MLPSVKLMFPVKGEESVSSERLYCLGQGCCLGEILRFADTR